MTTPGTHDLANEQLLDIAYYLRLTRTLEERLVALFRQAKVIGGLYRSLGQEGESVAAAYALDYKQGDVVQPLIRNLGAILVAGASSTSTSAIPRATASSDRSPCSAT